ARLLPSFSALATTPPATYSLSLHDALPICRLERGVEVAGAAVLVALTCVARHFHAHALGQFVDRVEELEAVEVHQERDRGAVRAAAEAVVELLGRRHRE